VQWQRSTASELRLVVADDALRADTAWRDSLTRALTAEEALLDVQFSVGVSRDAGAALVTALRRAGELTAQYRSVSRVDLTVVLPPRVSSRAGFDAWRAQWPGRVRVLQHGVSAVAQVDTTAADVQVVGGERDDIVPAALARSLPGATRVVRFERGGAERRGASASSIVVEWPLSGVPAEWTARPTADTVGAIVANGEVLVGPFVRTAALGAALQARVDSGPAAASPARVIAWWSDGEAAAVEQARAGADGCARSVAVVLPVAGDLLLSNEASGLRAALVAPCDASSVPSSSLESRRPRGDSLAPASAFRGAGPAQVTSDPWWLTPVLLTFAMAVLFGEWWWRKREASA
jgi:hypothetical protein